MSHIWALTNSCSCRRPRFRGTRQGVRCASRLLRPAVICASCVLWSAAAGAENTAQTHAAREGAAVSAKLSAAPPTIPEGQSRTGGVPADARAQTEQAAEAAYEQAHVKYARNDLKGALESMRESYRLCQRPELLYNLAMLERELHECSLAIADYTSYLQQVPQGRYREAAEKANAELAGECPVAVAAPPPSAAPQAAAPLLVTKVETTPTRESRTPAIAPPDPPYWTPPRVIGWSAVTAGVLAGAGALYFTVAALSARDDYQNSINAALHGTGPYDPSLQDKQHRDQRLADVLAVSGGALVTGGALVLIFGSKNAEHAAATAQLQARPGWLGACYSQRF